MFRGINGVIFALQLVDCEKKINILHIVLIQDCFSWSISCLCFVIWCHSHACKILCNQQKESGAEMRILMGLYEVRLNFFICEIKTW